MTLKAKNEGKSDSFVSNPLVFVEDALQFNRDLLSGRTEHYLQSMQLDEPISFFDRGIPDVLAYMDFFNQQYDEEFIKACENYRYDTIFLCPPWQEIYVSDNERLESYGEAENIHNALWNTYNQFGYQPVIVPKSPVEQRIDFILETLNS